MTPPAPVALEPVVPAEPIVPETHRPTPTAKRHSIGHSYSAMPVVRMPVPTLEAGRPATGLVLPKGLAKRALLSLVRAVEDKFIILI